LLLTVALQTGCRLPAGPDRDTPEVRSSRIAACGAILETDAENLAALRVLAHSVALDHPVDAIPVFERALAIDPTNWEMEFNLALRLRQVSQLAAAYTAFERAQSLRPTHAAAFVEAGPTALELGQPGRAVVQLRRGTSLAPDDGSGWGYLARALRLVGRHGEAVRMWDRAEQLRPHGFIDEADDRADYVDSSRRARGR
jgi:Flp pilus assembly protein TadD